MAISEQGLVDTLRGRGSLACGPGGIEFLFLNSCASTPVCRQLQSECGIPVVLGWSGAVVPVQQCLAMVRACICQRVSLKTPAHVSPAPVL